MKIDIEQLWYKKNILSVLLLPLSWLFMGFSWLRRIYLKSFNLDVGLSDVYVIVVGNITVGGAGKTPFVAWLAQRCKERNLNVGIVSRGYGRNNEQVLEEVSTSSAVDEVGDETLLLKQKTLVPVAVAADRCEAAGFLKSAYNLDIIISDDGLQHYKLPRDYEIIVVDGQREFGNGWCLPAGPLREPVSRLKKADMVISNGENPAYELQYGTDLQDAVSLSDNNYTKSLDHFGGLKVHAVAGIGHPTRFFNMLKKAGIDVITHAFPDHYAFQQSDLEFDDDLPIIMTEKDAVKCKSFATKNTWYVPISIVANAKLEERVEKLLKDIS